jgi:ubiquinone/menaquinone biosynthesis C-methylase UbiE
MAVDREKDRELAYRFDLFVAPDWCERFNEILDEHVEMPKEGRLLEINCGTGARAIAVSETLKEGEVVGTDAGAERVAIARAKASAAGSKRCSFVEANPERLGFETDSFDGVVLDASLTEPARLGAVVAEALRVAHDGAPVVIKTILRGSFDEFFSIYWETLHDLGIDGDTWAQLEQIITGHPTFAEALETVRGAGLREPKPHRTKEEWRFENGAAFLESPLVEDLFLGEWFAIVPEDRRDEVRASIERLIDRESDGVYFDVSAKALVVSGVK